MLKMLVSEEVKLLQTIPDHTSDVNSCDFGGNHLLVTGSSDKTVRLYEWQIGKGYTEKSYSPFLCHKYGVTCVKFSPQGTMLISASIDGTAALWNVRTGIRIHTFVQPLGGSVRVCRFSCDSKYLVTAGDDGSVCIWDLLHRSLLNSVQGHEGAVLALAFTPDASYLLTTCTLGTLKLWSVLALSSGEDCCLTTYDDACDLGVTTCDFSNVQSTTSDTEEPGHEYLLAVAGNNSIVKLWKVQVPKLGSGPCSIEPGVSLEGHESAITNVRFSHTGAFLSSSSIDKTIRIWKVGEENECCAILEGHGRYVACCAFSRDGQLLASGSNDRTTIIWDLTGGRVDFDTDLVPSCVVQSHLGVDNPEFSRVEENEMVKQAETDPNQVRLLQRLDEHFGVINGCQFYKNELLVSCGGDKMIRLWSRGDDGRFEECEISPLEGHRYSVNQVEFSPNGELIVSCSLDGLTLLWDVESGDIVPPESESQSTGVRTCRFSPNGHLIASGGDDERLYIWTTNNKEKLMEAEGHSDAISGVAFTHDNRYIASCSNDTSWRLWSIQPCHERSVIVQESAHDLGIQSVDFSPEVLNLEEDNTIRYVLASCGNDSLAKLWHIYVPLDGPDPNAAHWAELWKSFSGHGGNVMCVRFGPNLGGEVIATAATDKTARLWNTNTGDCLHVLENHESLLTTCAFSSDSTLLATGSLDKTIIIWQLPQDIIFQSLAAERLRAHHKKLLDWTVEEVGQWVLDIGFSDFRTLIQDAGIDGHQLLTKSPEEILDILQQDDETVRENITKELIWLKKQNDGTTEIDLDTHVPHEFLCPITHEIMKDPVICADGFTYERAAINEWFLSGKFSSPMTNATLVDTKCSPNHILRHDISSFLYDEK